MKKAIIITATALTFTSVLSSPLQVLAAQTTEKVESSNNVKTPRAVGVAEVSTAAELKAAVKNTTINEVQLKNDITLTSGLDPNHPVVINGLNHSLDMKNHTINPTRAASSLYFKDINLLNGQGGEVGTLNLAGTILADGTTDITFENTTHVGKELVNARTKTITFKGNNTFTNTGSTEYMAGKNVVVEDGASVLVQGSKNTTWDAPVMSFAYGGNGTFKMGTDSSFKIDNPGRGPALGRVWVEANDLDVYLGENSKLDLNSTTNSYTDSHALTFTKLIGNKGAEFKAYSNNADAIKAIRSGSTIDLSQTKFDIKTNNGNKNATALTGTSTILFDNKEVSSWAKGLVNGNPTQTWKNVQAVATFSNNSLKTITPADALPNFDLKSYGRISGLGEAVTNEKPVINASDKEITVGDNFDPKAGVTATDKEDGDLTSSVTVKSNNVDTNTPGTYDVVYTVTDSDGNTTEKTIKVTVKEKASNEKPVINASDKEITVGDNFDPKAGVTATDKEDGDLTSSVTVKSNNVDTNTPGTYDVVYTVTDSDGNTTEKTIKVTVKEKASNEKPVISASDKEITAGDNFDPKAGVTATDKEDGDLTSSVTVKSNNVDTNTPGTYEVVYTVTDSDGNTTEKTITVTVKAKEEKYDLTADDYTIDFQKGVVHGTHSDNITKVELWVDGERKQVGQVNADGTYDIWAGNHIISKDQNVVVKGYNQAGEEVKQVPVNIIDAQYTLTADDYTIDLKNGMVHGTHSNNITKVELWVNGERKQVGQVNADGTYDIWGGMNITDINQKVTVRGYNQKNQMVKEVPVNLHAPIEKYDLTADDYTIDFQKGVVHGTHSNNITKVELWVDGERKQVGQVNADGTYDIWAGNHVINANQNVVVKGYNQAGEEVKQVTVNIIDAQYTLTADDYTINLKNGMVHGTRSNNVTKVELWVDGTMKQVGQVNADGTYDIWGGMNITDINQKVTVRGYNQKNQMIKEVPVKLQAPLEKYDLTADDYTIDLKNGMVHGTRSENITKVTLVVDGVQKRVGQINAGGTYDIWAADTITNTNQKVFVKGYNKDGQEVKSVQVNIKPIPSSITADSFAVGSDNNVVGQVSSNVTKVVLSTNGQTRNGQVSGTGYSVYAKDLITSKDQVVYVIAYDASGAEVARTKVTLTQSVKEVQISADPYTLNDDFIIFSVSGKDKNDVTKVVLMDKTDNKALKTVLDISGGKIWAKDAINSQNMNHDLQLVAYNNNQELATTKVTVSSK